VNEKELKARLRDLAPGDPLEYNLLISELEQSGLTFYTRNIYTDSVGFLERWFVEDEEIAVIDGLSSPVMIRTTEAVRDETPEVLR
jgi:hypothetical protein